MKNILLLLALTFVSLSQAATTKIPASMLQGSIPTSKLSADTLVTAPGTTKIKTCYFGFGGASATLAAPTMCTTGACVEVYDSCAAVTPPTRSIAGGYLGLTIANGTFAANTYIDCKCNGYTTSNAARQCVFLFNTSQNTWGTNASGGYVSDLFTGIVTGTGADSYIQGKCEGQAPN